MTTHFIAVLTPVPKKCIVELTPEDIREILKNHPGQAQSISRVLTDLILTLRRECSP